MAQSKELEIFRLREDGHSAFVFNDAVFHFVDHGEVASVKYFNLLDVYGKRVYGIVERPQGIYKTKRGIAFIQKRGQEIDLSNIDYLNLLFQVIEKLHSLRVDKKILSLFNNPLLKDGFYQPDAVWGKHYKEQIKEYFPDQVTIIEELKDFLLEKVPVTVLRTKATLIHGDLHKGNILVFDNKIKLIDWSDARVDHPYLDFAQVAFQAKIQPEIDGLLYFVFLLVLWVKLYQPDNKMNNQISDYWIKKTDAFKPLKQIL